MFIGPVIVIKDPGTLRPHIQEMQQASDNLTKTPGHDSFPLASQMVVTETPRLPFNHPTPDGLLHNEVKTYVQLLQVTLRFHTWYTLDLWQLFQVQWPW